MTTPIEDVLRWVKSHPGDSTHLTQVSGATSEELAALATLGRLCGQALSTLRPSLTDADTDAFADAVLEYCGGSSAVVDWFLGTNCPRPTPQTVTSLLTLLDEDGEDGLARLYARLVAPSRRRRLGTFFTPPLEVDRMIAGWAEHGPTPATVIDVGAGVGAYTLAAAKQWPDATVHAIDINPVTLGLLSLRTAHTEHLNRTDPRHRSSQPRRSTTTPPAPQLSVPLNAGAVAEVSATEPRSSSTSTAQLVLDDYVSWATKNWHDLPAPRLVLGNPPYTRMQLLPMGVRENLFNRSQGLLGRRASLAVLMTAVTITLLEPDDGLCLLLPAQWLESDYARNLRAWLWSATHRRIELRLFPSSLFGDAQVDAVSLLIGPQRTNPEPFRVSTNSDPMRTCDRSGPCPDEWRSVFAQNSRMVATDPANGTQPGKNKPRSLSAVQPSAGRSRRTTHTVLADLCTVRRGVATGANWFFVLNESERSRLDIPLDAVRPLMRRLRDSTSATMKNRPWLHPVRAGGQFVPGDAVAEMAWLLTTGVAPTNEAVLAYLEYGERDGAAKPLLCDKRSSWHDLTPHLHDADVAVGPMSKGTFRVLEAPYGATVLNNLYGLRWRDETSEEERAHTVAYLRSPRGQEAIRCSARSQANGLYKIEPKALGALSLPT